MVIGHEAASCDPVALADIITALLSISMTSEVVLLLNIRHCHLSVYTCELWQNG